MLTGALVVTNNNRYFHMFPIYVERIGTYEFYQEFSGNLSWTSFSISGNVLTIMNGDGMPSISLSSLDGAISYIPV